MRNPDLPHPHYQFIEKLKSKDDEEERKNAPLFQQIRKEIAQCEQSQNLIMLQKILNLDKKVRGELKATVKGDSSNTYEVS